MSLIHELREEAQEWRAVVGNRSHIACMLNKAASTIESLAKMCQKAEFACRDRSNDTYCPWCGWNEYIGHDPTCEWITNGVAALLGEVTE